MDSMLVTSADTAASSSSLPLPSVSVSSADMTLSSSSLLKSYGENIPAEVRKISVDHSTGETILHKAARLGYLVTSCCTLHYSIVPLTYLLTVTVSEM